MARRKTGGIAGGFLVLAAVGLVAAFWQFFAVVAVIGGAVAVIGGIVWVIATLADKLLTRETVVLSPRLWTRHHESGIEMGWTRGAVMAHLGEPDAITDRVLKTKRTQVLKYGREGRRFAFKVKLENGLVIGWEGEWKRRPELNEIKQLGE